MASSNLSQAIGAHISASARGRLAARFGVDLHNQRHIGGINAGNTRRLAKRPRLNLLELGPRLGLQAGNRIEVEPVRDAPLLVAPVPLNVRLLPLEVALVLDFGLELRGNFRIDGRKRRGEIVPPNARSLKEMSIRLIVGFERLQKRNRASARALSLRCGVSRFAPEKPSRSPAPMAVNRRSALSCRRESRCCCP